MMLRKKMTTAAAAAGAVAMAQGAGQPGSVAYIA